LETRFFASDQLLQMASNVVVGDGSGEILWRHTVLVFSVFVGTTFEQQANHLAAAL
jgi:hypothetical protein